MKYATSLVNIAISSTLCIAAVGMALGQAPLPAAPPAAPPPGSPGVYVSDAQVTDQLKAALAKSADPAVAEIGATDQYAIHTVHRGKAGPAAMHVGWTELHYILEGGGTLVTGGKMITSASGNSIEGGTSRDVKKGDSVIIPPNTPHRYSQVSGSLTYLEVRFPSPAHN